jgi:parvulin-like peptidyl-prolyl isomerase
VLRAQGENVLGIRAFGRVGGAAVGLVVVAVGLAGCNTSPGAAALVGGDRISASALQHEVDRALALPNVQPQLSNNRVNFTRSELARMVTNLIVTAAAREHHLTVSQADIEQQINSFAQQAGGSSQLIQSAEQSGIPRQELQSFTHFYVLQQKLADLLIANIPVSQAQLQAAYQKNIDQYDQVHAAHILVKTKSLADTILAQVKKNPSSFAQLAAKDSTDTSTKNNGGDLGFAGRGQFVPQFSNAIFNAKPGSYIEVHSQFGWHVVHVIAHRVISLAQATPQLKTTLLQSTRDKLLAQALAQVGHKLGVHINPRYGRWDNATQTIVGVPLKDQVSSPSPSPSGGGAPAAPVG